MHKVDGHIKVVYHKRGISDHGFRFAKSNEKAENPYSRFVAPTVASWYTMKGTDVPSKRLRAYLERYKYGKQQFPLMDNVFLQQVDKHKPDWYPCSRRKTWSDRTEPRLHRTHSVRPFSYNGIKIL